MFKNIEELFKYIEVPFVLPVGKTFEPAALANLG
jgi:hypothetical protein